MQMRTSYRLVAHTTAVAIMTALAALMLGLMQLLTDGRNIYARTSSGAFFNLLKTPTQPLLVVGDEGLLKQLGGKVRRKRKKGHQHGSS